MRFGDAVRQCLALYATFSGRARRSEFWFFWLFTLLVQIAAGVLDAILFGGATLTSALASLVLLLPGLAVGARRLHDTGRSAWWLLVGLVPVVGIVVLIVFYLSEGEAGSNRFGPDPRQAGTLGGPDRPWQVNPPPAG